MINKYDRDTNGPMAPGRGIGFQSNEGGSSTMIGRIPVSSNVVPESGSVVAPRRSGAPHVRASQRLELSGASNLLAALKSNDVRTDKVALVRQQLADGTYDPDGKKLDMATDKLADELAGC